jgi:predicted O-linked N-acetylglucosamine transferase (SPINDLY family)
MSTDPFATALSALREGRFDRVEASARAILAAAPGDARGHALLGSALLHTGRLEQARRSLDAALARDAGLLPARLDRGELALREGHADEALADFVAATTLAPTLAATWAGQGRALLALERSGEALERLRHAQRLAPDDVATLEALARALVATRADLRELIAVREQLCRLEPRSPAAQQRLALAWLRGEFLAQAHAAFATALALDSDYLPARWCATLVPTQPVPGGTAERDAFRARWSEGMAWFECEPLDTPARAPHVATALLSATNLALHYLPGGLRDEQARYGGVLARMVGALAPAARPRATRHARPRIGLLSAQLRRHSVSKIALGLMDHRPTDAEIVLLHPDDRVDATTEAWRARADRYLGGRRSLAEWFARLAEAELDALVHLDVGLDPLATALAAWRAAPRQLAYWGHPITTGLATIDAFLAPESMLVGEADAQFRERLLRLPGVGAALLSPTIDDAATAPPIDPATTRGAPPRLLLGQNVAKLGPEHDAVLARIAARAPQVELHLTPHPQPHVRDALLARMRPAFAAHGVDADRRVVMHPNLEETAYRRLVASCALCLDSFEWSGGISTYEALALGVPVLTLPSATLRGRQSCAFLQAVDAEALIARDTDDYVERAVTLACDPPARTTLAQRIVANRARLFEAQHAAQAFWACALNR